jgi:hypothetical protein
MADGPVGTLPAGLDAYAGYVNQSGIGITYPGVLSRFPNARHLSITTNGSVAMCADVESGAMIHWTGYEYGYCSVSNVNELVAKYGRPARLWTAHYTGTAHICSPHCTPGLVTSADGTQWVDHGSWDESLLNDNFFDLTSPPPQGADMVIASTPSGNGYYIAKPDGSVDAYGDAVYHGGINNAGPGGASALVAGDACTGISVRPSGGYWLITEKGLVYGFGGAPHYGNAV